MDDHCSVSRFEGLWEGKKTHNHSAKLSGQELAVCLACLSVCLSVCQSVCLSVRPSLSPGILDNWLARLILRAAALSMRYPHDNMVTS